MAVRILSQASPSSECERNWSLSYQIHTKRKNRLEPNRINDIVYVTYNLRLKSSPSGGNEGDDDLNDANLQQVLVDFDD
ncbi:hypothetical protein Ahy_A10g048359 isoform B [Arachis hypogaea]|uniref:HAT C-terminal dimerisation domain-containing protein n=1 Tax=Arachis hypogaea TaxID=3818 RepID=A0A445B4Y2_ARAHY|nr:hypothetical protein Ahy_A10g048359 isoform B [Arachis hypogaea]